MGGLVRDPVSFLEMIPGKALAVDANVIVIGGAGLLEQLYGAAEYMASKTRRATSNYLKSKKASSSPPSLRDAMLRRVLARDDASAALAACSREFGANCITTESVLNEARSLYRSTPYTALFAAFNPGGKVTPADMDEAINAIFRVLGGRSWYKASKMIDQVRRELKKLMPIINIDRVDIWDLVERGDPIMLRLLAAANSVLGDPNCARQRRTPSPHPPLSKEDLELIYLAYRNRAVLATGDRQVARTYLALEGTTYYIYIDGVSTGEDGGKGDGGKRRCDPTPKLVATYCTKDGVQSDVYLPDSFTPKCRAATQL